MDAQLTSRATRKQLPAVNISAILGGVLLILLSIVVWRQIRIVSANHAEAQQAALAEQSKKDQKEYLEEVIPLYTDAVTATQHVAERTQNAQLRTFTQELSQEQTKEMWSLLSWYQSTHEGSLSALPTLKQPLIEVEGRTGDDLDRSFLQGIIDTNKVVISLSRSMTANVPEGDFKTMVSEITANKTAENEDLTEMLEPYLRQ